MYIRLKSIPVPIWATNRFHSCNYKEYGNLQLFPQIAHSNMAPVITLLDYARTSNCTIPTLTSLPCLQQHTKTPVRSGGTTCMAYICDTTKQWVEMCFRTLAAHKLECKMHAGSLFMVFRQDIAKLTSSSTYKAATECTLAGELVKPSLTLEACPQRASIGRTQ